LTGSDRHLLVVDDDDRIRELLKEYLARSGFRVTGASDAASASRLIDTLDFDLIVLDVMMPYMDGFEVLKNLKPGSRIVSHRFILGDWAPDRSITVMGADGDEYRLHLWIVKDAKQPKE